MATRKPHRIRGGNAPGSTGDLGDALQALAKAAAGRSGRPSGIRRTRSLNPSKVGVNEALRINPASRVPKPGVSPEAYPGESTRMPGLQIPMPGSLPGLGEQLTLFDMEPEGPTIDRTEVLSPPNSIEPGRPRALEARYDPDTKRLTVRFRNGGTYAYEGVPRQTWRALKRNKSFGQTMDRLVINQYPFEKIAF